MKTTSRGIRLFWLVGIALLLVTAAGSSVLLHQPATGTGPAAASDPPALGVVGHGFVDVESGITFLHPTQQGRVVNVFVKEGNVVKAGDLLLSVDNQIQRAKLRQAEADLAVAKSNLQDAETQLTQKWTQEIERQKQRTAAARSEVAVSENELKIQQNLYDSVPKQTSKEQLDIAKNKAEALKAAVLANEAALKEIEAMNPQGTIDRARANVKAKQAQYDEASTAFLDCDLYAPCDGAVLRLFATPGDVIGNQPRQPAVQFCPDSPRVVRVEILQEWASKIRPGQVAVIEDDTRNGAQWKGKVERVGDWFTQRRAPMHEPFQYNDVRTLECIVSIDAGGPPVHIWQRMRVTIKQGGP